MTEPNNLSAEIIHRFLLLLRNQRRTSALTLQQMQISGRQVAVLRFLLSAGPSTVSAVARYLYVRDATASSMLDRMESGGYITRARSEEDNRKVLIEPTDLGRQVAQEAPLGMIGQLRQVLPTLPAAELERMNAVMGRLISICGIDESQLD